MALVGGVGIRQPREISLAYKGVRFLDDAPNINFKTTMKLFRLSERVSDAIIKVARTIADIDKQPDIRPEHMTEEIHYRSLDKPHQTISDIVMVLG